MRTKVYSIVSFVIDDDGEHTEDSMPKEVWWSEGGGPGEGPGWYCGNPGSGDYSYAGATRAAAFDYALEKLERKGS